MSGTPIESPVEWLLDEVAIIAAHHESESELGAAALATHAVLAHLPTDVSDRARLRQRVATLAHQHASAFREQEGDLLRAVSMGRQMVLHEGYRVNPTHEGSDTVERVRLQLGARLIATPPDTWSRWGQKAAFRRRAQVLLGSCAVAPGHEHQIDSSSADRDITSLINQNGSRRSRVVKVPGTGGGGNLMFPAGVEAGLDEVSSLLRATTPGHEVVIEEWLEWDSSLCVSYLVQPGCAPMLVAVAEQVVNRRRAQFIGANSHTALPASDLAAVVATTGILVEAMAADGVLGVAAIDVIVGDGQRWGESGVLLPSGGRMCVIECNPRLNRHNRVGMLVERLARIWGIQRDGLAWSLRDRLRGTSRLREVVLPEAPTPDRPTVMELVDGHRVMTLAVELRRAAS